MPRVSVLQLDTDFPRIPGDVGCAVTFIEPPQIIRVRGASVSRIVSDRPQDIDIRPFETAVAEASGELIATSCGFLAPWQNHLATRARQPLVASALAALPGLYGLAPEALMIVTFDADKLGSTHLGSCPQYAPSIVGLPSDGHLRDVISNDHATLDPDIATQELLGMIASAITPTTRQILLECTNLPPYKHAVRAKFHLPVTDILTYIEGEVPGTVKPEWL